jgi:hypothetical protein
MRIRVVFPMALVLAISVLSSATAVRADQIDGEWCRANRSLSIDGPRMVTPGGQKIRGEYHRHGFHYIAPDGEHDAGSDITISQLSDDEMQLVRKAPGKPKPGPAASWHRCRVTS